MLGYTEDRYGGVTVIKDSLSDTVDGFTTELQNLINSLTNKKLLWVEIPSDKSEFIPVLISYGFEFHHCNEQNVMLVKGLVKNAFIPTTKNYLVGVGAVIISNDTLLVVKDKYVDGYKLPGGHIDKHESLKDALLREVREETGIEIELESIVNLGHFKYSQFGASSIYIVCTAKPKTHVISIHDTSEIVDATWMSIDTFLQDEDVNMYNKSVVNAAISNQELKLTEQKITLKVNGGEVFF